MISFLAILFLPWVAPTAWAYTEDYYALQFYVGFGLIEDGPAVEWDLGYDYGQIDYLWTKYPGAMSASESEPPDPLAPGMPYPLDRASAADYEADALLALAYGQWHASGYYEAMAERCAAK